MTEEEGKTLEQRLQADFSEGLVLGQGPFAMGYCYIKHLAQGNPFSAARKAIVMAYHYAQYIFNSRFGKEDLSKVFSVYGGMPVSLLEEAASRLIINPAFIEKTDSYRKEHNLDYCVIDIYTRDASCLVETFINSHRDELKEAGIIIRSVKANILEKRDGRFTGNAKTPILLRTKPLYLNSQLPYLTGKDEYRTYKKFLPNIVLV